MNSRARIGSRRRDSSRAAPTCCSSRPIFDTLNAKAAIFAILELEADLGEPLPVAVSGTITDLSGRTLSGQTVEAFWLSVQHADPLFVGLNCALGAEELEPYVAELSAVADVPVSCHPNAGLPNEFGGYDDTPAHMSDLLGDFADRRLLNLVGGCCGTEPEHIRAIAERMEGVPPRQRIRDRAAAPVLGPRAARDPAGHAVREHRRAHERDGLGPLRASDPGG